MKYLIHLLMMLSLLTIVSCGDKKTGATLKVSSGFALSNGSFQGGLVFFGRSTTGATFSAPIAYGAGTNEVVLDLDRGNWVIGAVGWNGDPDVFEGTAECAITTANLDSAEQTITLDLTTTGCANSAFGGNLGGGNFKILEVVTCGTHYSNVSSSTVLATDSPGYCSPTSTNIPPDMRIYAKSATVFVPAQFPGQAGYTSPLSKCIDLTNGQTNGASNIRLPADSLPLTVELFDGACSDTNRKMITGYPLGRGMNFSYPNFDKLLFSTNANYTRLYLLPTKSRKGTSNLLSSLPSFYCDSGNPQYACIALPDYSSANRLVRPDTWFFYRNIVGNDSCSDFSALTLSGGGSLSGFTTTDNCLSRDGKLFLKLTDTMMSGCTSSACTLTSTFATSPSTTVTFKKTSGFDTFKLYETIYRIAGHADLDYGSLTGNQQAGYNSLDIFHEKDKHAFGILENVREFFRPDSVGGILGQYTSTELNSKSFNLTIWEDGEQKMFQIRSDADSTAIPHYISTGSDASTFTSRSFTHKVTISQIVGGAYYPKTVMRYVHGSKVGMLEDKHDQEESGPGKIRNERSLIYWNTENADDARFEHYQWEQEIDATTSQVISTRTSFDRAEREDSATLKNARIESHSFESRLNAGNYDENAGKTAVILRGGNALVKHSMIKKSATTQEGLFSEDSLKDYRNSIAISDSGATATSPNGNIMVMAWAEYEGTSDWDLKVIIKSATAARTVHYFEIDADQSFIPKVAVNNDGTVTVALSALIGSQYNLFAFVKDGANWEAPGVGSVSSTISTTFNAFSNYLNQQTTDIKFVVIDLNPASSNSTKQVVWHDTGNDMLTRDFTAGAWSASNITFLSGVSSYVPIQLEAIKHGSNYFFGATYFDGTDYKLQLWKAPNPAPYFNTSTLSHSGTTSGFGPNASTKLWATSDGTNLKWYVKTTSPNYLSWTTDGVTNCSAGTTLCGAGTTLSNISFEQPTPYCTGRSVSSSLSLGAATVAGCAIPDNSFMFPIRSEFKMKTQDLKPSNFDDMFSIP